MGRKKYFLLILIILLVVSVVQAVNSQDIINSSDNIGQLPKNVQKVDEYNKQQAEFYLRNLSFLVAFLVGVVSILSPCSFALIPPFFAVTFKEKRQLVKMTFAFFLGFTPIFVALGMTASFLGKTIGIFQQSNKAIVIISGTLLILFGVMTLLGKGLLSFHSNKKVKKNFFGIFLFGAFFAFGFTACMGPALFGILIIAGLLKSYAYAALLMLFYSFGLFVPFFIAAFFFDKYNVSRLFSKINAKIGFSITNIIAGIILIATGFVFIFYGGTFIVEYLGLGSLSVQNYAFQNKVISNKLSNIIGGVILVAFVLFLWFVMRRKNEK